MDFLVNFFKWYFSVSNRYNYYVYVERKYENEKFVINVEKKIIKIVNFVIVVEINLIMIL